MPELSNNFVLGGLATCAVGIVGCGLFLAYRRRGKSYSPKFTAVGVVSRMYIHPIKSCRGIEIPEAESFEMGFQYYGLMDRSFLIIDGQDTFLTGRTHPTICRIQTSLSEDKKSLLLDAEGMDTLTVPLVAPPGEVVDTKVFTNSVRGEDCGREAGEWLSQYFGSPGFRLIRHKDRLFQRSTKNHPKWGVYGNENEKIVYHDKGQAHILGQASLDDLNSRIETPVQDRNFRANIVFEGSPAFSEDSWKYIRIGESTLRQSYPCGRCLMTTLNVDTGKYFENGEPLKTLRKYRLARPDDPDKEKHGQSPLFGIIVVVEQGGKIKVGDTVYASLS